MEIQNRIVDSPLCTVCLCTGRTLHEIGDHKMLLYYVNTLREIPLCSTDILSPALCFECMAILKRVTTFRDQAKVSYCILRTHANQNRRECLIRDVARPPRLKLHRNDPITITPMDDLSDYIQDVHKDDNTDVGVQRVFVKEEIKKEWQNSGWPHRPRLRNDPITITDKDGCDITPKGQRNADDVQRLEVKQEIKIEWDDNEDDDNDLPQSDCSQDLLIETDKQETSSKREKKRRKKSLKGRDRKLKKSKRSKTEKEPKESEKPEQNVHKILTIELTYDEMLAEREKESKRESYVNSEYKCESCLIGFSYSKSHAAHLAAKHSADIGNYSCPICKTVMASVESFTSHYKRHMRRYECNICSKRTMDLKAMQQHYYSAHSITLKEYNCTCNICGEVSESIDKHRYHRDSHKARVQCPECEKTFSHRTGLMNHRLSVHEYRNDFPCAVCSKVFRWKTSLKRHFDKHHSKDDHAEPAAHCALCKVSFTSQSSLQRHLRNSLRHVTPNQLKFICDECNRRFADKTKLRDHIEEKHLHKTYQCHLCLKPSKNRVGLDQHIRNVHKGRPNNKICHHCGKGFPTRVQLESHIRSHTGERPFICEFCPTTFSQQSNLYKHNRQLY